MKSWLAKTWSERGPSMGRGHTGAASQTAAATRTRTLQLDLKSAMRRHAGDACLAVALLAYLTWVLLWQHTLFNEGRFGYHDLTLITDFFTNALYHGKPFWITDYEIFHFQIHFTPTLALLTPFFLFFKSQFALIAIVATTVAAGLFVASREQHSSLAEAGVPQVYRVLLTGSFLLLLGFNRYTLRCLDSAHFEPVFILPAMLVLAAIRRGASYGRTLALCALALGVRQDTGLFLFFMLAACAIAPMSWRRMQRSRVAAAALLCVTYVVFATKLALPWFGSDTATRMWHRWGETWPDVFLSWTENPRLVWEAVGSSEFLAWNAEFYFLHVVHGLAWLLTQAPAILFYTADAWDKQRLAYYNTSFLLPGVALCLGFTQLHASAFIQRVAGRIEPVRHVCLTLLTGLFVYAALNTAFFGQRENEDTLVYSPTKRSDIFSKTELRHLLKCPNVRSVATDFNSIVFVPLALDKYLPRHADRADVAVYKHDDKRKLPYAIPPEQLRKNLAEHGYTLAYNVDGYDVFLAPGLQCP